MIQMSTFLPIRGTQTVIDATPIIDGQILFTTDTNNIYIDNGTIRTLYRSVSTVQLSSTNTTTDAIAFGKDGSGNYGYYEAGSSTLKPFRRGNASAAQVLSPYTFSNASASGLIGTMPNNGSLSFSPSSSTTQSLPAGYYSGGTLSTVNAYNKGYSDKKLHRISIGSGGNGTYSAASIDGYANFTSDNFAFIPTYGSGSGSFDGSGSNGVSFSAGGNAGTSPSISYNPETGIVTISGCSNNTSSNYHTQTESGNVYGAVSITGTIYCYYAA